MSTFSIITHPFISLGFIALHFFCGQLLTTYLYRRRFKKNPLICYQNKQNNVHSVISRWLSIPVSIWVIGLCCYAFSPAFRSSVVGSSWITLNPLYGWILGITGLFGMLVCQYQMGEAFRIGQEETESVLQNRFVREGCFNYSRNPIYVFSMMYLIGVSLWAMIWPVWLSLGTILVLIHRLVLTEEAFLTQRFGNAYTNYKNSVPRYWSLSKRG